MFEDSNIPTAYNQATWAPGPDGDTTLAPWHIDDYVETVQLRIAAAGPLRGISMSRWDNTAGASYGRHPFGVIIEDQPAFDGIHIPSAVHAFWARERRTRTPASSSENTSVP